LTGYRSEAALDSTRKENEAVAAPTAIEILADLLSQPEGSWALADGALAIARLESPQLDPAPVQQRLDQLGRIARERLGSAQHPRFAAAAISRVLFFENSLRAPSDHEEQTAMSMIDSVLETGVGTPTLLAVIYIEVARRAGLRFSSVALPGRFLLRHDTVDQYSLFDPQAAGKPIDLEACRAIVSNHSGGKTEFREAFLRPLSNGQLLARVISQLKAIYWRSSQHERALTTVRMLLTIRPDDPREIRDQGRLYYLMNRLPEAIHAFENYLHHNPRGEDAEAVRMLLLEARASLGS
jgi:regulator of sirC expression with transglutaminase-like and TPR domain